MSRQRSIETLKNLVEIASVSSDSNLAIAEVVQQRLEALGFLVERTTYEDPHGIAKVNLVARRDPVSVSTQDSPPGLAYFCHTDVVPAIGWTGPGGDPFAAVLQGERLYGRGSCDMKGSLAAMLTAAREVNAAEQTAPLWIVCTADEEVGFCGAKHLVRESAAYREIVDAQPLAIIGEPTQMSVVHAHKGITGFQITSLGRAAHSGTDDGINANQAMVPMLQTLLEINQRSRQDSRYLDHRFDPPSLSWNFGVSDGTSAVNITPQKSVAWVSLRPMPEIDGNDLIELAAARARSLDLEFNVLGGGAPFWVDPEAAHVRELCALVGGSPRTVCYGTDGGELRELRNRVVIGPGHIAQAHTSDEWIEIDQLQRAAELYEKAIGRWCCGQAQSS
jgi:acetylornithine deacetylase